MAKNQLQATLDSSGTSRSLTEATYERLREDVLTCRLVPGAKLNVKELSEHLDSNPAAVRESLSRLAARELVLIEPQKGFRVAPMSVFELQDLTDVRIELESAALRRSISAGDLEWEARVVATFHRLSKSVRDADAAHEWELAHAAFHQALISACPSRWLQRLRGMLYDQNARYRMLSVAIDGTKRDLHGEHKALMEAAVGRDSARAATVFAKHLRATTETILRAIEKDVGLQSWFANDP